MQLPRAIRKKRDTVKGMWFTPVLLTLLGAVLGELIPVLDRHLAGSGTYLKEAASLLYRFQVEPGSAQTLLSTAAGALATIVAVAFSITMVTVQLASTQFTPLLLRNFMSDRATQKVLGCFTGTVLYLLLVLRAVETGGSPRAPDGFLPLLTMLGALLFTGGCLLLLPYFLHHVTRSIQATTIAANVAKRTTNTVRKLELCAEEGAERCVPPGPARVVESRRTGYLQLMDEARLRKCLPRWCRCARVEVSAGDFVLPGMALVTLWPDRPLEPRHLRRVQDAFALGRERVLDQDVRFGVRQLVDMALKALSPGINDVTTALMAINELGALGLELAYAGVRPEPGWRVHQGDGAPTLLVPVLGMSTFLEDAFDEITVAAKAHPRVLARILELLTQLSTLPGRPELVPGLLDTGRKVHHFAEHSGLEGAFRGEVERRWNRLRTTSLAPGEHPPHPPFIQ